MPRLLNALIPFIRLLCCAANASNHKPFYVASSWSRYPGYTGSVDATQFTGHVTVEEGPSSNEVLLSGAMSGLPEGTFGIHIHSGFDVSERATIGSHFYPGLESDPWNDVKYTGPTWTIEPKIVVAGINFESSLGRVMVLHDATDRVGIAKLLPFPDNNQDLKFTSADLKPFSSYTALTTTLGVYPVSAAKGQGSVTSDSKVWVSEKADGRYVVSYVLNGLPAEETSGGIHIHSGTSCATHEEVLGHYHTTASDPWTTVWTKIAGATTATGTVEVDNPGFDLGMNEHHALVVHESDGDRIACGILHSVASALVTPLNANSVTGRVWLAETNRTTGSLRVSYSLSGLPDGVIEGGLHVHAGKSCAEPGPHFWASGPDPWTVTSWRRNSSSNATAVGYFDIESGYDLLDNADHAVMVHGPDGYIGCGALHFTPAVTGFVSAVTKVQSGAAVLRLSGNLAGLSSLPCAASFGAPCGLSVGPAGSCSVMDATGVTDTLALDDASLLALRAPAGGLTAEGGPGNSGGYAVDAEFEINASMAAVGAVVRVHGPTGEMVACGEVEERAVGGLTAEEIEELKQSTIKDDNQDGDDDDDNDDDDDDESAGVRPVSSQFLVVVVTVVAALPTLVTAADVRR